MFDMDQKFTEKLTYRQAHEIICRSLTKRIYVTGSDYPDGCTHESFAIKGFVTDVLVPFQSSGYLIVHWRDHFVRYDRNKLAEIIDREGDDIFGPDFDRMANMPDIYEITDQEYHRLLLDFLQGRVELIREFEGFVESKGIKYDSYI